MDLILHAVVPFIAGLWLGDKLFDYWERRREPKSLRKLRKDVNRRLGLWLADNPAQVMATARALLVTVPEELREMEDAELSSLTNALISSYNGYYWGTAQVRMVTTLRGTSVEESYGPRIKWPAAVEVGDGNPG